MANKDATLAGQTAEALQHLTGLDVTYDPAADTLSLIHRGRPTTFHVQAVMRLTKAKIAEIVGASIQKEAVVIAPALTPEQARQLREAGVNYADAAGNAHLKAEGLVIFIEGQKPTRSTPAVEHVGRAFQPAGLKVLFTLLVDPGRANETYRDLAARVAVSPATVKHVLDDLERRGNVIKIGRGRGMSRRLLSGTDLAQRWANSYSDVLRPKLLRGRYRFLHQDQHRHWKTIDLHPETSCWGGEPAADLYEGRLRPEVLTLYTTARTADLARTLHIVPDAEGPIEVLDKFWTKDVKIIAGHSTAPRLLAYADLLASGETRNLEAAPLLLTAWADATIHQQ